MKHITSIPKYANILLGTIGILLPFVQHALSVNGISTGVESEKEFAFHGGLVLFLVSVMIEITRQVRSMLREVKEVKKSIYDIDLKGCDIEVLGTDKDTLPRYVEEILSANSIYNSFLCPSSFDTEIEEQMVKVYQKWLASDHADTWQDITGISEFFSDRYKRIKVRKAKGNHKIFVLREGTKIMNFTILDYKNTSRKSVVYFGWLPDRGVNESKIMRSDDDNVVQLFRSHFSYLKTNSWNLMSIGFGKGEIRDGYHVDHTSQNVVEKLYVDKDLVDKKGTWIAYTFKGRWSKPLLHSVAIQKIDFESEFVLVSGKVYDSRLKSIGAFESDSSSTFYLNSIYTSYNFKRKNKFNKSGKCHYQFTRSEKIGDVFRSVFFDESVSGPTYSIGIRADFDFNELDSIELSEDIVEIIAKNKDRILEMSESEKEDLIMGPKILPPQG